MFDKKEYMKEYNKEYYIKNKEKILKYDKEYRTKNRNKILKYKKQYREENKDLICQRGKQYREENKDKIREGRKRYYKKNKEYMLNKNKKWHIENKEYRKQYRKENRTKIKKYLNQWRNNRDIFDLKYVLNRRIRSSIRKSLKKNKGGKHWEDLVPYNFTQLKNYLQKTLPKNYTWQDYLEGKLQIDHIIPIRTFEFKTPEDEEFRECWSLYNLRLLPTEENRIKKDKITNPILLGLLLGRISELLF